MNTAFLTGSGDYVDEAADTIITDMEGHVGNAGLLLGEESDHTYCIYTYILLKCWTMAQKHLG